MHLTTVLEIMVNSVELHSASVNNACFKKNLAIHLRWWNKCSLNADMIFYANRIGLFKGAFIYIYLTSRERPLSPAVCVVPYLIFGHECACLSTNLRPLCSVSVSWYNVVDVTVHLCSGLNKAMTGASFFHIIYQIQRKGVGRVLVVDEKLVMSHSSSIV